MRKIILFIASSLDGYIARSDGSIDWLFHYEDYGYTEFFDSIDTTLMGNKTYQQVLTFDEFPNKSKTNIVFTRNQNYQDNSNAKFISKDITKFCKELKLMPGKDIWLVGGGEIIQIFLENNLIDEFTISIHPIILGNGIPLFRTVQEQKELKLIDTKTFKSGLVQINYRIK